MDKMLSMPGGRGRRGNEPPRIRRQIYYVAIAAETKCRRSRSVTRFPAPRRAHCRRSVLEQPLNPVSSRRANGIFVALLSSGECAAKFSSPER